MSGKRISMNRNPMNCRKRMTVRKKRKLLPWMRMNLHFLKRKVFHFRKQMSFLFRNTKERIRRILTG